MDVHEQSAMGLDSRAVSDRVTKQIVTIFSKTCNNRFYCTLRDDVIIMINHNNCYWNDHLLYLLQQVTYGFFKKV